MRKADVGSAPRTSGVVVEALATSNVLHDPETRFVSQATYRFPKTDAGGGVRFSRTREDIVEIGEFSHDWDFYKGPYAHLPVEFVADMLTAAWDEAGLPRFTQMIATGTGLRTRVEFTGPAPAAALSRWEAVVRLAVGEVARPTRRGDAPDVIAARAELQRRHDLLAPFCPDHQAMDATRVFRVPGTISEKNGVEVRVLRDTGARWSFEDLCREILPLGRDRLKEIRAATKARREAFTAKRTHDRKPVTILTQATRFQTVVNDLEKIAAAFPDMKPRKGSRRMWLMLYVNAVVQIDDDVEALDAALAHHVAAGVTMPAQARNAVSAVRKRQVKARAGETSSWGGEERSPLYGYSGRKIAEALGVDAAMARRLDLRIVAPDAVKKERKAETARKTREAAGATPRARARDMRQEIARDAAALLAAGHSVRSAAREIGCHESTVRKALDEAGVDRPRRCKTMAVADIPAAAAQECGRYVTVSVGSSIQSRPETGGGSGEDDAAPSPSTRPRGLAGLRLVHDADEGDPWTGMRDRTEPAPWTIRPEDEIDFDVFGYGDGLPAAPPTPRVPMPKRTWRKRPGAAQRPLGLPRDPDALTQHEIRLAFLKAGYSPESIEATFRENAREKRLARFRNA